MRDAPQASDRFCARASSYDRISTPGIVRAAPRLEQWSARLDRTQQPLVDCDDLVDHDAAGTTALRIARKSRWRLRVTTPTRRLWWQRRHDQISAPRADDESFPAALSLRFATVQMSVDAEHPHPFGRAPRRLPSHRDIESALATRANSRAAGATRPHKRRGWIGGEAIGLTCR